MNRKQLVLVRHGNTFRPGETPLRVGCRTDLPLVEQQRARGAGLEMLRRNLLPDRVFAAPLKRTMETARLILETLEIDRDIVSASIFTEIDYGPDEGKTEEEVMLRLGKEGVPQDRRNDLSDEEALLRGRQAIDLWNERAIPPHDWLVDPEKLARNWIDFAADIAEGETVLVVSSNGILRFAPNILPPDDRRRFVAEHDLKVTTGGLCLFCRDESSWKVEAWNVKPIVSGR